MSYDGLDRMLTDVMKASLWCCCIHMLAFSFAFYDCQSLRLSGIVFGFRGKNRLVGVGKWLLVGDSVRTNGSMFYVLFPLW